MDVPQCVRLQKEVNHQSHVLQLQSQEYLNIQQVLIMKMAGGLFWLLIHMKGINQQLIDRNNWFPLCPLSNGSWVFNLERWQASTDVTVSIKK